MQYEPVQYENVEKLNRQGLWFVVIHTLILFNFVIDFEFFQHFRNEAVSAAVNIFRDQHMVAGFQ